MLKKSLKWVTFSLMTLLLVSFAFVFVGCSNKDNNTNNAHPANSIPDANVYEDIADYVLKNGEKQDDGSYFFYIVGNNTVQKAIFVGYNPTHNFIGIAAQDKNIGGFEIYFTKGADYSKTNHEMLVVHPIGDSNWSYNKMNLPATTYVDLNTTTKLTDFSFQYDSSLNKEEEKEFLKKLAPLVTEGLNAFSDFYANIIKQNAQFTGATYKYFYLPVMQ